MIVRETPPPQHAAILHGGEAVRTASAPAESENAGPGRWIAWLIALAVMGALIGVVVVLIMKFVNGPVEASANTVLQPGSQTPPPVTTSQLAGQYIQLTYPGIFDEVGQMKNFANTLEAYSITSKRDSRRNISVNVSNLPSNSLDDDSSYKFRLISTTDYTRSTDKIGGEEVVLMTRKDKTEQTLFWAHKGKEVIIAVTSTVSHDSVQDFVSQIKPTLRWRE